MTIETKDLQKTINLARGWYKKGFNTEQIAYGVWHQVGYRCESEGPHKIIIQIGKKKTQIIDLE